MYVDATLYYDKVIKQWLYQDAWFWYPTYQPTIEMSKQWLNCKFGYTVFNLIG